MKTLNLSLLAAALLPATLVKASNFVDNFARPDSPAVSNGWQNAANTSGILQIVGGMVQFSSTSGGDAGICRHANFGGPVTVSATLKEMNGFGGRSRRYNHRLVILCDGNINTGYGINIGRSDSSISNSEIRLVDGSNELAIVSSTFQFGPEINVQFTVAPDGAVTGFVSDASNTSPFSFAARNIASHGQMFMYGTSAADSRTSSFIFPRADDISIADAVEASPLVDHVHDPSDGELAIKGLRMESNTCLFNVSLGRLGSICLVSWSDDLRRWFPLVRFAAMSEGTEIKDIPSGPRKFYRTTYLPDGATIADSFNYPIGSGKVLEQIEPEDKNDLYPELINPSDQRGAPPTANVAVWRNVQDVGNYEVSQKGIHAGEDWNLGSSNDDVGEPVKVAANGQVIDIRQAHPNGPEYSGYAVLVRHWLDNGDTIDSLYLHLAPDYINGSSNSAGIQGSESEFSVQEGDYVSKGDILGVIGTVTSPDMYPHLHFEMRTTKVDPANLWPSDTGNAYYGPVTGPDGKRPSGISRADLSATFILMQKDGIIDPSDYIDQHR